MGELQGSFKLSRKKGAMIYLAVFNIILGFVEANSKCHSDGIQVDYSSGCREYYQCTAGRITIKFTCAPGKIYSYSAGQCIPRKRGTCITRQCSQTDTMAYVSPGTKCKEYYRCINGTALDLVCPNGTWFDFERQACTRGAGACYEPLCAGLIDGYYPDTNNDCRRLLHCKGGDLKGVTPCDGKQCPTNCPSPRTTSISVPVGDVDFCTDDLCTSLCIFKKDGAHADLSTGCKEFFVCSQGRVTQKGVCDRGTLFYNGECVLKAFATCSPPKKGKCFGMPDGAHRDWKDCRSWFACRRDKVVATGSCDLNHVWDGYSCVLKSAFYCEGPTVSNSCFGRPKGFYQDLDWNCARYYRCENNLRFNFHCPLGYGFDGSKCALLATFTCPSVGEDSCYRKPDGKYKIDGSGCRGYYTCVSGEKSLYACPSGYAFNGSGCFEAHSVTCPDEEQACLNIKDGYHPDLSTNCRQYFYCEQGDRIATFECSGGRLFNGNECVEQTQYVCGESRTFSDGKCDKDGFFVLPKSNCRVYYFCIDQSKTLLRCGVGKVFNGAVCVPESKFTCDE